MGIGNVKVVVGGLFGSEGKGAVAAHLSHPRELGDGLAIRVGGSNAGHSAIDPTGRRWALRHIPVAAVVNPDAMLALAAGSEIDLDVLADEVHQLETAGFRIRDRLYVDPGATVVTPAHKAKEEKDGLTGRIGSTAKGVGAARANRIWRAAPTVRDSPGAVTGLLGLPNAAVVADVAELSRVCLDANATVLVEGTQGYGLGLHTRFYPYVTSADCRAVDILAQAGVSPWAGHLLEIYLVYRPNPIRVAGNSGPLEGETTWEQLGLPPEQTTVTRKTRRVGVWDDRLAREAWLANGGGHRRAGVVVPVMAMADHQFPEIAGWSNTETELTDKQDQTLNDTVWPWADRVENACFDGVEFAIYGTGPGTVLDFR